MSSVVSTVCRAITSVVECVNFVRNVTKIPEASCRNEKTNRVMIAISLGVGLGCNVGGACADIGGASAKTLKTIKSVEVISRALEAPFAIEQALREVSAHFDQGRTNQIDLKHLIAFWERGVFSPLLSVTRAQEELKLLTERSYLELPQDEFEKTTRPEQKENERGNIITEQIPLDRQDCFKRINALQESVNSSKIKEAVVRLGLATSCASGLEARFKELSNAIQRHYVLRPNTSVLLDPRVIEVFPEQERGVLFENQLQQVPPQALPLDVDPCHLENLPFIPEFLHNDAVFAENICPITWQPIRHPVEDPHDHKIYERDAFVQELTRSGRSPLTRIPLTVSEIVPRPDLQAKIDDKLRKYQQSFSRVVQEHEREGGRV